MDALLTLWKVASALGRRRGEITAVEEKIAVKVAAAVASLEAAARLVEKARVQSAEVRLRDAFYEFYLARSAQGATDAIRTDAKRLATSRRALQRVVLIQFDHLRTPADRGTDDNGRSIEAAFDWAEQMVEEHLLTPSQVKAVRGAKHAAHRSTASLTGRIEEARTESGGPGHGRAIPTAPSTGRAIFGAEIDPVLDHSWLVQTAGADPALGWVTFVSAYLRSRPEEGCSEELTESLLSCLGLRPDDAYEDADRGIDDGTDRAAPWRPPTLITNMPLIQSRRRSPITRDMQSDDDRHD